MTIKSSALDVMRGYHVERIPFIGRMDLWYNYHYKKGTLPKRYQGWSQWDIHRDLGIGIYGWLGPDFSIYKLVPRRVDIKTTTSGTEKVIEYRTPYGTLRSRYIQSPEIIEAGILRGMHVEHIFKDERDYDALLYYIENTEVVENFEEYCKFADLIGEDGIASPDLGRLPMHQLMHFYMGYERFYYEINDHPDKVEELHQALLAQHRQVMQLAVRSPLTVFHVGANYDELLTPPPIFKEYFCPFYQETAKLFEAHGKILVVHGDGEMRELLRLLMEAKVHVVEAITPKPMTSIDIRRTRELWAGKVTMWGGIPAIILTEDFSDEEFEDHLLDLFRAVAPGDRFILGFGDNVPTEALFHRIVRTAEFYQEHATYPITL